MFIKIDEPFICENCGASVPALKYSCRNHCPKCLYSKHVDIEPGDRLQSCKGLLRPIGVEKDPKKEYVIIFKCEKCGMIRKNKKADDDDFDVLMKVVKKASI